MQLPLLDLQNTSGFLKDVVPRVGLSSCSFSTAKADMQVQGQRAAALCVVNINVSAWLVDWVLNSNQQVGLPQFGMLLISLGSQISEKWKS